MRQATLFAADLLHLGLLPRARQGGALSPTQRSGQLEVDRSHPSVSVLRLIGEHDMATAPKAREAFAAELKERSAVIDLSDATFIDSAILNVILQARRGGEQGGRRVVLAFGSTELVGRILEVSGVLDHVPCFGSRAEAVAAAERE